MPKPTSNVSVVSGVTGVTGVTGVSGVTPPLLGEEAYEGPIGDFLHEVDPSTEATVAGILAHLLPAIGTYIGPGPFTSTSGDRQSARVNTVLVGPTSTGRKGTSRVPVDRLMKLVEPGFWMEQCVGGLSTGEGLINKVADKKEWNEELEEEEVVPVDKRCHAIEPEFSRVLVQIRRPENILSQVLRECFDSGNLYVLTRNNPLQAIGAHISVTAHITAEELAARFSGIEMANGFGNRFLWFFVRSDKIKPFCDPFPDGAFERFALRIRHLGNLPDSEITLAPQTREMWQQIYPSLRAEKPGFAGMMLARGSSIVLRVALIYSLLDPAPRSVKKMIWPIHLNAALAVWRYNEESVRLLFGKRAGTSLGDSILKQLAEGPLTKEQLNGHVSKGQRQELRPVLRELEAAALIQSSKRKEGTGRPATVYELVR